MDYTYIVLGFLWVMPMLSMQQASIQAVYGNWLAESAGGNQVEIFFCGNGKQYVRSLAVYHSTKKPAISALCWSQKGRYLAITSQDKVDIWDADGNTFVDETLPAELTQLRASFNQNRKLKVHEKIRKLQQAFEDK